MTRVKDILQKKGSRVVYIDPTITLRQALNTMIENKVGALSVKDDSGNIVGIITERDVMREVHAYADLEARSVQSVMTANIISATREDGIDTVMEQMTENRFRHVPILEKGRLVGIISIGDLVKSQLSYLKHQMEDLKGYVAGHAA
jgi:CBS domain-containing protein